MLLLIHVTLSLYALLAGVFVVAHLLQGRRSHLWTATFLASTILTSVTGYFFHSSTFGPPQIVGVVSLIALALAVFALYVHDLKGPWRVTYVTTAVLAFYLNAFVGLVQAFDKIPFLHVLAPKGSGPVFALAQVALLTAFVVIGFRAVKRFRPEPRTSTARVAALD